MILIGRCFGIILLLDDVFLPTINFFQTKSFLFDTFSKNKPTPLSLKKQHLCQDFRKTKACLSYSPLVKKTSQKLGTLRGQKLWHIDNAHKGGATSVPWTKHRNIGSFFGAVVGWFFFLGGVHGPLGLPEKAGQSVFWGGSHLMGCHFFGGVRGRGHGRVRMQN